MTLAQTGEWHIVLANYTGVDQFDMSKARSRRVMFRLNKPDTVELTLDPQHPGLSALADEPHALIKAYKNGTLVQLYEITSIQLKGAGKDRSVAIVGTEAAFVRLGKRWVGKSVNGSKWTAAPRNGIVAFELAITNLESETGIEAGTFDTIGDTTVGPIYYKRFTDWLKDLADPLDGFDYWFDPIDPNVDAGHIADMNISPVRGAELPGIVFRYGQSFGRTQNLISYDWTVNVGDRITRATSLPPTYPNNQGLGPVGYADGFYEFFIGMRQEVLQDDLVDPALRLALTTETVNVRKNPRNIYTFAPAVRDTTGRVWSFLEDYNIGDQVIGQVNDLGLVNLDGMVRIHEATVTIDERGAEQVELVTEEQQ